MHVHNAGVAFGLLNEVSHPERGLITVGARHRGARRHRLLRAAHHGARNGSPRLGLSLILGGAIGNLTDRLWQGFVVDFVDVYWRGWHFWAFNVADSAITVGAIFVFIELLLPSRHASHSL